MDSATPTATPELRNRAAFEEALANYQISDRAKRVLQEIRLVLINGPSGVGRNTTINYMVNELGGYQFVVSDTSRPPRINKGVLEQNGREYWFRTEEDMLQGLRAGEYLEAEVIHEQQVSGISVRELEKIQAEGKIAINEVEYRGLQNVLRDKPNTLAIIMLPPSYAEWRRRLTDRGKMSHTELKNRLETAATIFEGATDATIPIVINETVEQAALTIDRYAQGSPVDQILQQEGQALAVQLLEATQAELQKI